MVTPKWATALVVEVCEAEGVDVPDLQWWRSPNQKHSSGRYWEGKHRKAGRPMIHLTAGSDRGDQKLVLLHELAHHVTPGDHHGPRFWDTAWMLYRRYNLPIRATLKREGAYRKEAIAAYERSRPSLAAKSGLAKSG